jgi:gliding motility-associated protein GldM
VLTALLALNVQREVLDAFITMDEGLQHGIKNYSLKNGAIYDDFESTAAAAGGKAKIYYEKALEVQKFSSEIYEYIQECKAEIVETADKKASEAAVKRAEGKVEHVYVSEIKATDNMDVPGEIMILNGRGKELREKIEEFRHYCEGEIRERDTAVMHSIHRALETHDHKDKKSGEEHSWQSYNFEHLPLAGVVAIMSRIQLDVRNAESEMINYLKRQIDVGTVKFNKVGVEVVPNSKTVMQGNEYEAEIFIAATDTTKDPLIYVGVEGSRKEVEEEGKIFYTMEGEEGKDFYKVKIDSLSKKGVYKKMANATGKYRYEGYIEIQNTDGTRIQKPFEDSYIVSPKSLVVSPTAMNVFYIGVNNPVEISVPGVSSDKITAGISRGALTKIGPGKYNAKVTGGAGAIARITVTAEIDGERANMGSKEFRIKDIPTPVAMVAGKKGGGIQKEILQNQRYVVAAMEDFVFDLQVNVVKFTVSATVNSFLQEETVYGNMLNDKQKGIIRAVARGQRVYFQDIVAQTPAGKKDLPIVSFKLQ